jgi:hypothetical protein
MKSWRGPRVALGLALLTLSLIYFVTLFWGPEDAETDEQRNYLRDLGDAPAESTEGMAPVTPPTSLAPSGDARPTWSPEDSPSWMLPGAPVFRLRFAVRDRDAGVSIPQATVHIARAAGHREHLASFSTSQQGRAQSPQLPAGQLHYWVTAPGHYPSERQAMEIPHDGTNYQVELVPCAQLAGAFETADGATVREGVLHLTRVDRPEVHIVRPDEDGRFASPRIEGGEWTLAWMPDEHARPYPALNRTMSLREGETTLLEVVLPARAGKTATRTPGIRRAMASSGAEDQLGRRNSQKPRPSSRTPISSR